MVSDIPEIEINIFINGQEKEYFINGYNGRFDWKLIQEFEKDIDEDTPDSLIKIVDQTGIDYGICTVLAQLSKVDPEIQYGTGYGDILTLPGYYHIERVEIISYDVMDRMHEKELNESEFLDF